MKAEEEKGNKKRGKFLKRLLTKGEFFSQLDGLEVAVTPANTGLYLFVKPF